MNKVLLNLIIDSLYNHPEDWHYNKFRAVHKNGATVWISNEYYGLSYGMDTFGESNGGVTEWSSVFGRLIPWRRKLMKAVLFMRNTKEVKAFSE